MGGWKARRRWRTVSQRDYLMADYLAEMCYGQCRHPSLGKAVLSAYGHLNPEHSGMMKVASRALSCWKKLFAVLEREPLPAILVYVLILEGVRGCDFAEALAYAIHFNGFLRDQDIEQARNEDWAHVGFHVQCSR